MTTKTNAEKQDETMQNTDNKSAKVAEENPNKISGLVTVREGYKSPRDGGMHLLPPCPNCGHARYNKCGCKTKGTK